MDAIQLLVSEHENIKRMNQVIRNICLTVLDGADVPAADLKNIIHFIRNYADKHHHGKEEQLLFHEMQNRLGAVADNLVRHGMLVEHDLARLYVLEWETALQEYEASHSKGSRLDIITYASGYAKLLNRHIDKEDAVVYTYARKQLSTEVLSSLNRATEEFEEKADREQVQTRCLALLNELEERY